MKLISELILLTAVPVVQDFPVKIRATGWKIELKNLIIIIKNPQSMSEELSKNNKQAILQEFSDLELPIPLIHGEDVLVSVSGKHTLK